MNEIEKINTDYCFHDSVLLSVAEDTYTDELVFRINLYEKPKNVISNLIFDNVIEYEVHEGPFSGSPTILEISAVGEKEVYSRKRIKVRIDTNAGFRTLCCTGVRVEGAK